MPLTRKNMHFVARMFSPVRLAYGLIPVVGCLRERGIDHAALFDRAGIPAFALSEPNYTVTYDQERTLYALALEALGSPDAIFDIVDHFQLRNFSVLGLTMSCADNLLDILRLLTAYPRLSWATSDLTIYTDHDMIVVEAEPFYKSGPLSGTLLVRDIAVGKRLFSEAKGGHIRFSRMEFSHQAPSARARYEEAFGCPVHFGCEGDRYFLPFEEFGEPLPGSDPISRNFFEGQCAKLNEQLDMPFRFTDAVKFRVARSAPAAQLDDIAGQMAMTPRTLQRRLDAEGTSFREIHQDIRCDHARTLLRESGLPIERIAEQVGFSDGVAFTRAFRLWTGQTPGAYRKAVS